MLFHHCKIWQLAMAQEIDLLPIQPSSAALSHCPCLPVKSQMGDGLGVVDDEEWEEALASCKKVSPKLSDRLTHLYILHRSYLTPICLSKYRPDHSSACPRCGDPRGTFYHLLWSCLPLQEYWSQVITFLHDRMGSPLMLRPHQCSTGPLPHLRRGKRNLTIVLQETLFMARMQIARYGSKFRPPLPNNGSGQ